MSKVTMQRGDSMTVTFRFDWPESAPAPEFPIDLIGLEVQVQSAARAFIRKSARQAGVSLQGLVWSDGTPLLPH